MIRLIRIRNLIHDTRRIGFWLGLALFAGILLLTDLHPGEPRVTRMAAVAALMAVWWISEALPLAVTALVPLVAFPLFGILKGRETAPIYVNVYEDLAADTYWLLIAGSPDATRWGR